MAYFPSTTARQVFEKAECLNCIHDPDEPEGICAVRDIHCLFNSDQMVDGDRENPLGFAMSRLIEDHKPLGQMCQMRVAKAVRAKGGS